MDTGIHGYQFSLDTWILGYFGYQFFSLSIFWISYLSIRIFLDTFLNHRMWKKTIKFKCWEKTSNLCKAHIFKDDSWHFVNQIFRQDNILMSFPKNCYWGTDQKTKLLFTLISLITVEVGINVEVEAKIAKSLNVEAGIKVEVGKYLWNQ